MGKFKYEIYLSNIYGKRVKLPVLPAELPEKTVAADVEDFVSFKKGHYTIIGPRQQMTVSPEHMIPEKGKPLTFTMSKTTGDQVLKILKSATKNQTPVKYVIAKKSGGYYLNDYFAVGTYSSHRDKKNDWIISFDLTGWKEYKGWKSAAGSGAQIKLTPTKVTIRKGKKKTATLKNVSRTAKITWKSSNNKVVTVNSKGVMTGKGKGKAKVTATCYKKTYTCEVGVK